MVGKGGRGANPVMGGRGSNCLKAGIGMIVGIMSWVTLAPLEAIPPPEVDPDTLAIPSGLETFF